MACGSGQMQLCWCEMAVAVKAWLVTSEQRSGPQLCINNLCNLENKGRKEISGSLKKIKHDEDSLKKGREEKKTACSGKTGYGIICRRTPAVEDSLFHVITSRQK